MVQMRVNHRGGKGIAHSHRVYNLRNVKDAGVIHRAVGKEDASEGVMVGTDLIAYADEYLTALRELTVQGIEPVGIGRQVHLIVGRQCRERHLWMSRHHIPLYGIAEDDVAVLHQSVERLMGVSARVFPKVFTIVDVARDGDSQLLCHLHSLECGVGSTLRYGTCDARAMEYGGILESLLPVNHPRLQF